MHVEKDGCGRMETHFKVSFGRETTGNQRQTPSRYDIVLRRHRKEQRA